MTKTVVGLDCGASHSSMIIWRDEKKVLENHTLFGANPDLMKSKDLKEYFLLEFEKLLDFKNAYWVVGMAGLDDSKEISETENWFREILEVSLPYSGLTVMSDIEMVLWSGSKTGEGIGLIAGTGSNCLGRDLVGNIKKVGGISHLLSDEGSGFSLGSKALHLITKMSDGRADKTILLDEVLKLYGVNNPVDLKNYLLNQGNQKAEIARSAPLILAAADRGEEEAERVVMEELSELVQMVIVVNKYFPEYLLPVFLAGSLFKNTNYLEHFIVNLHKAFSDQKIRVVSPIDGAINFYNSISL